MEMQLEGRVWKLGDNVDTDTIIPGKYLASLDPREMVSHLFENLVPGLADKLKKNDIIVAGENFGCGSSRELAPLALKCAGISIIIAESFARIFYRNAVNIGLPVLMCKGIASSVEEGDVLRVDLKHCTIRNMSTGETIEFLPIPEHIMEILKHGGLVNKVKHELYTTGKN